MKLPGISFSLKRAVGLTGLKQKVSQSTGVPLTKQGLERKVGSTILGILGGKKKSTKRRK